MNRHPAVFTPGNEPYLGRELLSHLDRLISSCLGQNSSVAPKTRGLTLTGSQRMACLVIPQAISIALSIRELIRQGYLFGGHVLVRPFAERAVILLYLFTFPEEIEKWNRGWLHDEAPSLAKMIESIQPRTDNGKAKWRGHEVTAAMNSLLHGKPDSAAWCVVPVDDVRFGYAPSKILNRPELCDELCANVIPWLVVVQGMMTAYFPS